MTVDEKLERAIAGLRFSIELIESILTGKEIKVVDKKRKRDE